MGNNLNTVTQERSITLECIRNVWKHRRSFLTFYIILFSGALLYTFIAPKWYMSKVTFIVEPEVPTIPFTSIIIKSPLRISSVVKSRTARYVGMLYSRSILDSIIEDFDLDEVYGKRVREDIYDELLENVIFIDNMDRTITILCYYKEDRFKAAEMANAFYRRLKELDENLSRQRAREFRAYMEENYREALQNLHIAEEELKEYQDKHGVVALEEQTKKLIEVVTGLESQKMSYEIEQDYLRDVTAGEHPRLLELANLLKSLDDKIYSITHDSLYATLVLGELPDISLEYARFYREVSLSEKLVEYLITQVEQAKIDERKKSTNLLLLEEGVPAERYAKPRRIQILSLSLFFGFFLSIFYVQMLEFYDEWRHDLMKILKGGENHPSNS